MIDRTELKRLAEAATPGPWHVCYAGSHADWIAVGAEQNALKSDAWKGSWAYPDSLIHVLGQPSHSEPNHNDAAFVAAANPQAVLALIAELEAAEKRIEELNHAAARESPST